MRSNFHSVKKVTQQHQLDIKLELDVRCQRIIERILRSSYPGFSLLGEEGVLGDQQAEHRWVVDPIDGTVNFAYGIPHCCVSVALQSRPAEHASRVRKGFSDDYETLVGVVYDPFCEELWTAIRGQPARLNGRLIRVSRRTQLREAIVSVGFAKYSHTLERMLPVLDYLIHKVRKVRIMGAGLRVSLGIGFSTIPGQGHRNTSVGRVGASW